MKTLILLIVFALLPLFAVNAQNEKVIDPNTKQTYTVEWKDITCPDCQGWGWILGEGFKYNAPPSFTGNGTNRPVNQRGVSNTGVDKYKCMSCNGTGKIQVKYYKHTL
ncbi:MAG: hypothetical protein WC644_09810 [Ignavibacteria bacterium]